MRCDKKTKNQVSLAAIYWSAYQASLTLTDIRGSTLLYADIYLDRKNKVPTGGLPATQPAIASPKELIAAPESQVEHTAQRMDHSNNEGFDVSFRESLHRLESLSQSSNDPTFVAQGKRQASMLFPM